jgi:hypothetical protein
VYRQLVLEGDGLADGARDGLEGLGVRLRGEALGDLHHHRHLLPRLGLQREDSRATGPHRRVGLLHRELDVLRIVVAPADDEEVLETTRDQQRPVLHRGLGVLDDGARGVRGARRLSRVSGSTAGRVAAHRGHPPFSHLGLINAALHIDLALRLRDEGEQRRPHLIRDALRRGP